ncbi:MAG: IPT/TIG domain-containing protein [Candidatus Harrisonbacteria bacterium]|nr:IPT/TIG domain-containing protein [Candidatus Harrisonbacteria bacterium]
MKTFIKISVLGLLAFMLVPQAMAATAQISSVSPSTVYYNQSSWGGSNPNPNLYIYGTGFETNATILIDGSEATLGAAPYITSTFMSIKLPTQLSNGSHSVQVRNPSFFSGTTESNAKTFTVSGSSYVGEAEEELATPSISFTKSGAENGTILSWTVTNAQRCVLQYGSQEETVGLSGSKTVSPSVSTEYKLWCANDPGDGKDGPSASETLDVPPYNVESGPQISSLSPSSGPVGTWVTIQGTGFSGNDQIAFVGNVTGNAIMGMEVILKNQSSTNSGTRHRFQIPQTITVEGEAGMGTFTVVPGSYYFAVSNEIGKSYLKYFTVTATQSSSDSGSCLFGIGNCNSSDDSGSDTEADNDDSSDGPSREQLLEMIAALQAQLVALLQQLFSQLQSN